MPHYFLNKWKKRKIKMNHLKWDLRSKETWCHWPAHTKKLPFSFQSTQWVKPKLKVFRIKQRNFEKEVNRNKEWHLQLVLWWLCNRTQLWDIFKRSCAVVEEQISHTSLTSLISFGRCIINDAQTVMLHCARVKSHVLDFWRWHVAVRRLLCCFRMNYSVGL